MSQHIRSTMNKTVELSDSTESVLSDQETCLTSKGAKNETGKRSLSRKEKSRPKKRKKRTRKRNPERVKPIDEVEEIDSVQGTDKEEDIDPVNGTNEEEDIENSRIKFYNAIESNCDKYIPPNARRKFPVKTKIDKLIQMFTGPMPSCPLKHSLEKKWTVKDGKLCHATTKNKEKGRKVTAYEDIFHQIFKVDKMNDFQRNIEGLAMDVKEQSNNISKCLVQLYSECCHKRDHKVRGVKAKREKSKTQEDEEKQKIAEFIETLNECTTVGYFQNLNVETHTAEGEPSATNECTVVDEPLPNVSVAGQAKEATIAEEPTEVPKSPENEDRRAIAQLQEDASASEATIATGQANENEECSGDRNLEDFTKLEQGYLTKQGLRRLKLHATQFFLPPYGFNNDDEMNVLCWFNSLLMIVLHFLPMHVILPLIDMNFPNWTEMKYSSTNNEFVGHAYDLVRQMIQVQPKLRLALNGNGVIKPYPARMAQIFRNEINRKEGRGQNNSSIINPETQVDVAEMMIQRKGILTWMNQLDPCNKHFLLPELEIVNMSSINCQKQMKNYTNNCNEDFEGPDGVLSIIDWDSIPNWLHQYSKHIEDVETRVFNGKKIKDMNSEEGKKMQIYQETFKVDLTIQELLDMSYGKIQKEGNTYTFKKFKNFSDYIAITMTSPISLDHFRTVDRHEDEATKEYRVGKNYRHGETRLYHEPRPIRYGIKGNTNVMANIYHLPETIEEAENRTKREVQRNYKLYGLIVRPIGETDTGSGHFECFVRAQKNKRGKEVWRHFDDDQEIKEYDTKQLPNLDKYTIVVVFMKDVQAHPWGGTMMSRRTLCGLISNNFQT